MKITLTEEMRRVAISHARNGERLTADVLDRAREHILDLEDVVREQRKRLERIANAKQSERTGASLRALSIMKAQKPT